MNNFNIFNKYIWENVNWNQLIPDEHIIIKQG